MITAIHDANYYPFANKLQTKLNETYGEFLEKCVAFFEQQQEISKNFATYIRETDPLNPYKNEFTFIIELDDHTLLDLTGKYDTKTDTIEDISFCATLPYHETWHSHYFRGISLSENEKHAFLFLQELFTDFCQKTGVRFVFGMVEFNPDVDTLPEAVVEFTPMNGTFSDWIQDGTFFSFLFEYYKYCFEMGKLFEQATKNTK